MSKKRYWKRKSRHWHMNVVINRIIFRLSALLGLVRFVNDVRMYQ